MAVDRIIELFSLTLPIQRKQI